MPGPPVDGLPGVVPGSENAASWIWASSGSAWSLIGGVSGIAVRPNATGWSPVSAVSWKSGAGFASDAGCRVGGERADADGPAGPDEAGEHEAEDQAGVHRISTA